MRITKVKTFHKFILFLVATSFKYCAGKVEPVDLSFEPNGKLGACFAPRKNQYITEELFKGCKGAVERAFSRKPRHPDHGKSVEEMVARQGYLLKSYDVYTEDGYILTLFRIPGAPNNPAKPGKPVVFLMHGLLQSSESWFIFEGEHGLALKLASQGFDVFLGNSRGTSYSLGHRTLDSDEDAEYWHFSWHQMGYYDLPANIQKILQVTRANKISYVGFSMGTTQYFVGVSERPELNNKIEAAVLLSPVAYMGHSDSPIKWATPVLAEPNAKKILGPITSGRLDTIHQMLKFKNASSENACAESAYLCGLCGFLPYFLSGFNPEQTNYTNLANAFSKCDEAVSVNAVLHYMQNMNSCQFRKYDFGRRQNLQMYGSVKPPEYQIDRITVPTYFFQGALDKFAYPEDVNITKNRMRPGVVQKQIMIPRDVWHHFDFFGGIDAEALVFNKVAKILSMHVNNDVDLDRIN